MLNLDEDALTCDLAETYNIYEYRSLPLKSVATFSAGLRDNSRIKMKAADVSAEQNTIFLAAIVDGIEALRYGLFGSRGAKRPESVVGALLGKEKKTGVKGFSTPEEFEAELRRLRGE